MNASDAALDAAFRAAVAALRATPVAHAVIGALARGAWSHPRATTDVDFAIAYDGAQWPLVVKASPMQG